MSRVRVQGLLLLAAAAGFAAVCVPGLPALAGGSALIPADEPDAAATTLARLDDDWSAAAATRDAEKVASFYAEDTVAYPPDEPRVVGRAAAKAVWAAYFAEPSLTISWKTQHAEVAKSGEMGFTTGPYELTVNGPDGKPVVEKGKYLCIWKKGKDGSWKATHDMWNSDAK
jgi:ketosteroid isomerase-like protein